jgi:hypothetical protein
LKVIPNLLLSALFLLAFYQSSSQDLKWIRYGRGDKSESNKTWAVATDRSGNIFSAGYFSSNVDLGDTVLNFDGKNYLFIVKHDSTGRVLWARAMGRSNASNYYNEIDIKVDENGNAYVMGTLRFFDTFNAIEGINMKPYGFYIVKYSPSGSPIWVKGYGQPLRLLDSDVRYEVNALELNKGNLYVTGSFNAPMSLGSTQLGLHKSEFGSDDQDMFFCKLDLDGNIQMAVAYGDVRVQEYGTDIAVDDLGYIYITGWGIGGILKYSDKGVLVTKPKLGYVGLESRGIGLDGNGNIYQFALSKNGATIQDKALEGASRSSLVLLKYNKNFDLLWYKYSRGGYVTLLCDAMETDLSGNTYIAGDAWSKLIVEADTIDDGLFIVKYDSSGAVKGTNHIRTNDGYAHDLSIGPNGRYYLGGNRSLDFFVAAYKDTLKNTSPSWDAIDHLRTGVITGNSVELKWDDLGSKESEFIIERSIYPTRGFFPVGTVGANINTYIDKYELIDFRTYYYRVVGNSATEYSKYSNVVVAKTLLLPPKTPAYLLTQNGWNDMSLYWEQNAKAVGYVLEVSISDSQHYTLLDSLTNSNFVLLNLKSNTQYYFRVRAYNSAGTSNYAELAYKSDLLLPPNNVKATVLSDTSISLEWSDRSSLEEGFIIEKSLAVNGPFTVVDTTKADVASIGIGNLNGNTKYYFRLKAYNSTFQSVYSFIVSAKTHPAAPDAPSGPLKVLNTSTSEYTTKVLVGLSYLWSVSPSNAGVVTVVSTGKIKVTWSQEYTGEAQVKVKALDNSGNGTFSSVDVKVLSTLIQTSVPMGPMSICKNSGNATYSVSSIEGANSYTWTLIPEGAGRIIGTGASIVVDWDDVFSGDVQLFARGYNEIDEGMSSESLVIVIKDALSKLSIPQGESVVCSEIDAIYTVTEVKDTEIYEWKLEPVQAGQILTVANTSTIQWEKSFQGKAQISVRAVNSCNQGEYSEKLALTVNSAPSVPSVIRGDSIICSDQGKSTFLLTVANDVENYEWGLMPENAGYVYSIDRGVEVQWDSSFTGTAKLNLKATNSCGASGIRVVTISRNKCLSAGIVNLFPNPTNNAVYIEIDSQYAGKSTFEIIKTDGQLLISGMLRESKTRIDLAPNIGIFLVKVSTEDGVSYRKIIVK